MQLRNKCCSLPQSVALFRGTQILPKVTLFHVCVHLDHLEGLAEIDANSQGQLPDILAEEFRKLHFCILNKPTESLL